MSSKIHSYLAKLGLNARRKIEKLIEEKKLFKCLPENVSIGERYLKDYLYFTYNNDNITVFYKSRMYERKQKPKEDVFIKLNKPRGYVTSMKDRFKRTITELLPPFSVRIFPVGRLDEDSEGLLILTNNGDVANTLMHPSFAVKREYYVKLNKALSSYHIKALKKGPVIDKKTLNIEIRKTYNEHITLIIKEGRKRIIRRAFESLGYKVEVLKRTAFGPVKLNSLSPGAFQLFSLKEKQALFKLFMRVKT